MENKMAISPESNQSILSTLKSLTKNKEVPLNGSENGRINILLLGTAGKGKPGQNLTDTIMVASVNTKTNQVALLSIPRDFYAEVPSNQSADNFKTKINSIYQYGTNNLGSEKDGAELVEKTAESILGIDINYYTILNFDGFKKVIDSIGGVNIMNERDIYDARYPGPNYSYETFELKKGFHTLDGSTALKYVRERHDDPEGDFGRAKRQQQVMQAAKNKIFSLSSMLNPFAMNDLLGSLGDNIKTNIEPNEISSFIELAKKLDTNNISNVVIDAWNPDSLLRVSHVFYGENSEIRAFVLIPRIGNYSEIQELAQNVFDLNKLKKRTEEISKEEASVAIINKSGDATLTGKITHLLRDDFSYKKVNIINDPQKNTENETTSFDLTGGTKPFTLDELASKIPAKVSYSPSDSYKQLTERSDSDIVIVLGKDIISEYNMEEDSVEEYKNSADDNQYLELMNK
jgi:LCP family protein required for cell wall assembly